MKSKYSISRDIFCHGKHQKSVRSWFLSHNIFLQTWKDFTLFLQHRLKNLRWFSFAKLAIFLPKYFWSKTSSTNFFLPDSNNILTWWHLDFGVILNEFGRNDLIIFFCLLSPKVILLPEMLWPKVHRKCLIGPEIATSDMEIWGDRKSALIWDTNFLKHFRFLL